MTWIDVFNGDADGLCALHQLRMQTPQLAARLITGVKRDIALLDRIKDASDSRITVLDISLDRNRVSLSRLLDQNNRIFYADHHFSGPIPTHGLLEAHIDPSPLTCTSLIIDQLLNGAHRPWAIAGAFGDNLDEVARGLAASINLSEAQLQILRDIGRLLNYNGYGLSEEDLLIHPADLFREVHRYADPFAFHRDSLLLAQLRRGHEDDMAQVAQLQPETVSAGGRVFRLPVATWANRVIGVLANRFSRDEPALAHAVLLSRPEGGFQVSVRAPLATRQGADTLCRQFPGGGGRAAAAGIDHLPDATLPAFLAAFTAHFAPQ